MTTWRIENWNTGRNYKVDLMPEDIEAIKKTYADFEVTVDDLWEIIVIHTDII